MYRTYKIIKGKQQQPHDAGCDAFTPVWLGKQPTDEARKRKNKGKDEKTDIARQDKKKEVVRSVGVNICIYITSTGNQLIKNNH